MSYPDEPDTCIYRSQSFTHWASHVILPSWLGSLFKLPLMTAGYLMIGMNLCLVLQLFFPLEADVITPNFPWRQVFKVPLYALACSGPALVHLSIKALHSGSWRVTLVIVLHMLTFFTLVAMATDALNWAPLHDYDETHTWVKAAMFYIAISPAAAHLSYRIGQLVRHWWRRTGPFTPTTGRKGIRS